MNFSLRLTGAFKARAAARRGSIPLIVREPFEVYRPIEFHGSRSPVNYERAHQRSSQESKSFYRLQRQTALAEEFA